MDTLNDKDAQAVQRRAFLKSGIAAAVAGAAAPVFGRTATSVPDAAIGRLKSRVRGTVATAGEAGYDEGRRAWNLAVEQRPLVAVSTAREEDIAAAIQFAGEQGLGIAVQGTGHGITVPANGGVVVNTSRMRGVRIDAAVRTAKVEPGAVWSDVIPKAHEFGLAPLSGSSSGVGVLGYTLGGGSGWLGRMYGYAADSVVSARVATAGGRLLRADARTNSELFWALRGGTSNFGIVTELEFKLYPVSHVYGGGLYWPIERGVEVANLYREFAARAPEAVTSRLEVVQLPPLPSIPKEMWGKWLVAVQGAFNGPEAAGAALFAPFRKLGGIVEDALGMIPVTAADSIARDPLDPIPSLMHSETLDEIPPELVRYLVEEVARPGSPVAFVELRHQGGAFSRLPEIPSAVGVRMRGFWMNAIAAVMPPGGRDAALGALNRIRSEVKQWATGAVFLNGIDEFGADRVRSAYGPDTWRRLATLKRQYDPANLFRFNRNVPPAA